MVVVVVFTVARVGLAGVDDAQPWLMQCKMLLQRLRTLWLAWQPKTVAVEAETARLKEAAVVMTATVSECVVCVRRQLGASCCRLHRRDP